MLLILTPGQDQAALLSYAATLAADNRSSLTVAEILTENLAGVEEGVSSPDELEEHMVESRRRRLEVTVSQLTLEIHVQTKVLVGKPHEAITQEVVSNGRDLVLKAAEDGRGLKERLFGNIDSRLWKACPCPVLLIRSIPPKPYRYRRICAGVYQDEHPGGHRDDRHKMNHSILEKAAWLAAAQFAELHIVHIWEAYGEQHLRSARSPLHFEAENYVAREQQRNRDALDTYLSELRESMNNKALPAFKPVCHLVKGSHRDDDYPNGKRYECRLGRSRRDHSYRHQRIDYRQHGRGCRKESRLLRAHYQAVCICHIGSGGGPLSCRLADATLSTPREVSPRFY